VTLGGEGGAQLPADLLAVTWFLLGKSADRATEMVDNALSPFGIRRRHFGVLVVLAESPGSSQQEVADRLGIDRTTMAKIVDDLEELRLLRRTTHPKSRRANALELTPSGSRLLPRATKAVEEADDRLVTSLSRSQRHQLRRLLQVVAGHGAAGRNLRTRRGS
jgi:DNA-binding MarR family transcriptional regulator